MKPVYLIIFMEKSPTLFHTTDQYIHKKHSYFDTGIKLNLLDNITFISLDTFSSVVQNVNTERDAWFKFLTEDDPDEIVRFINQYPEFLPCYRDLISFRQNPKELICMFSDALNELDRNTERYMVEELNREVEELNNTISELKNNASDLENTVTDLEGTVTVLEKSSSEKDLIIDNLQEEKASMAKRIAELEAQLNNS